MSLTPAPDIQEVQLGSWTLTVRLPARTERPFPAVFLIHGWTGDERSMWVFAPRLPKDALLIAPRAPYASSHPELAGHSWVERRGSEFSPLTAFGPSLDAFEGMLTDLALRYPEADFRCFSLMGFSQGAAFSFACALRHPQRVSRLAALAGFLPPGSESQLAALANIPIFIAHGSKDETVPIDQARAMRAALEAAGIGVEYCESETGHKLGANCAPRLQEFFK
ncbi:MAG: dienelactone hydrolase family protein [Anaerolineales bacterium]